MPRFLTTYTVEADQIQVYSESDDISHATDDVSDWVWQWAPDKETARMQHFDKLDEWEMDPTKDTY